MRRLPDPNDDSNMGGLFRHYRNAQVAQPPVMMAQPMDMAPPPQTEQPQTQAMPSWEEIKKTWSKDGTDRSATNRSSGVAQAVTAAMRAAAQNGGGYGREAGRTILGA